MRDNGQAIKIDIQTSEFSATEMLGNNTRFILGYLKGEFSKLVTTKELYIKLYYKANSSNSWSSVSYTIQPSLKRFYFKIPSLSVSNFYVQIYGDIDGGDEIEPDFEITNLEITYKILYLGKHGEAIPQLQM